jgi:Transposase DDE domain
LNEIKKKQEDYCRCLLAAQTNYTCTYYADHDAHLSHDKITRALNKMDINHNTLWYNVRHHVVIDEDGYIIFDDTVLDKSHSHKIDMVRRQYSGNAHGIIKGIGVVNCVYVNSKTKEEYIIDYRIFNPESDEKTKIDHVSDMLDSLVYEKKLPFKIVLMDTWYAVKELILKIESFGKIYFCPMKSNRLVDDSNRVEKMKNIKSLNWTEHEKQYGKLIHIKNFPAGHIVRIFCLEVSTSRTDYIVTNSLDTHSIDDIDKICSIRWRIEQFHREVKQLTGIEKCQCRKQDSQKNHIGCAILLLAKLKEYARKMHTTVYQLKQNLLSNYMINELKNPSIIINFA